MLVRYRVAKDRTWCLVTKIKSILIHSKIIDTILFIPSFSMIDPVNKAESSPAVPCRKDGKGVRPICDRLGVVSSDAEGE
jgi:hypothetical protein